MSARIRLEPEPPFGRIILDNPPCNTLPQHVFADLRHIGAFLAQPHTKGAIVIGAGEHFCAGAECADALIQMLRYAPVPVVAAIRGQVRGAGLDIARACHFRVVARTADPGSTTESAGDDRGGVFADIVCETADIERDARSLLMTLCGRRHAAVVRAAMTSIANAQRLQLRDALLAESRLFCDLAKRSELIDSPAEAR